MATDFLTGKNVFIRNGYTWVYRYRYTQGKAHPFPKSEPLLTGTQTIWLH